MPTTEPPPDPRRASVTEDWSAVLHLIRSAFAAMDGRIDPPTSMHRLTEADIAGQNSDGEVWLTGSPPFACVFLSPFPHALHIGKLAVAAGHRRQGHAARLIALAETRARVLGLPALELQTRVELTDNHAAFAALGFVQTGTIAHPGFHRPTSVTMQKRLGP